MFFRDFFIMLRSFLNARGVGTGKIVTEVGIGEGNTSKVVVLKIGKNAGVNVKGQSGRWLGAGVAAVGSGIVVGYFLTSFLKL